MKDYTQMMKFVYTNLSEFAERNELTLNLSSHGRECRRYSFYTNDCPYTQVKINEYTVMFDMCGNATHTAMRIIKDMIVRLKEYGIPVKFNPYEKEPNVNVTTHCITTIQQPLPEIKKVYFNGPATVVLWEDGTKTVVKCQDVDYYNPEHGLAMAISKKALGNKGNFNEVFKKWLPEEKSSNTQVDDLVAALADFVGIIYKKEESE